MQESQTIKNVSAVKKHSMLWEDFKQNYNKGEL